MDDVNCYGMEMRLTNCIYVGHTADCSHFEDVFVTCQGIRLKYQ